MTNDPLMAMRVEEQKALQRLMANPIKMKQIRGAVEERQALLAQTELESRALRCAYDANVDGWSASAFHAGVDKQGPGIVLARTAGGLAVL